MPEKIELKVTGMTCDHCVRAVTDALKDVQGVAEATVSLQERSASVPGIAVDIAKLLQAAEEQGYEATVSA